ARAQGGLYFNPIVTVVHNSVADTGPFAFLGEAQKQQIFGGVVFGGYYEVYHAPKYNVSLDFRDEVEHGNDAGLNNLLFGPRFTYLPSSSKLKPYLQIAVGAGSTHSPKNPKRVTKLESAFLIGVDRPLNRHIDWRIVEVGYGTLQTVSSSIFSGGVGVNVPSAHLYHFSTGLVFRLP
ncbi:MAG: hypothetical protein ABI142_09195, partial [Bryocella sp.]